MKDIKTFVHVRIGTGVAAGIERMVGMVATRLDSLKQTVRRQCILFDVSQGRAQLAVVPIRREGSKIRPTVWR
jgi:hypothetical protein